MRCVGEGRLWKQWYCSKSQNRSFLDNTCKYWHNMWQLLFNIDHEVRIFRVIYNSYGFSLKCSATIHYSAYSVIQTLNPHLLELTKVIFNEFYYNLQDGCHLACNLYFNHLYNVNCFFTLIASIHTSTRSTERVQWCRRYLDSG